MGKQQRDNAMFEYLELYVYVDITTDNHDLFSELKTTFRHAFRTCSLKSVLWVDEDVFKPGFIVNYTVLHKSKTIVTNYSSRHQHTRTRLYCCWVFFSNIHPTRYVVFFISTFHMLSINFGIQNTENIHMIWKSIWSTLISLYQQIVSFVMYEAFRTLVLPFWSAEWTVCVWCFLGHFCLSRQVFPQNTRLKVFQNFSLNQQ